MLLEYTGIYDIIKTVWRFFNIMFELFLIAMDKLMDNPKITICALIISAGIVVFLGWRAKYVFRRVYVEKQLSKLMSLYLRKIIYMLFPIVCLTEIMVNISAVMYKDGKPYNLSFLIYYIPMLFLIICFNMSKIKKERNEAYLKCFLWLLPGVSFHTLFLTFLVCSDKSPIVLGIVLILGIITPTIIGAVIRIVVSPKDTKMIKVELSNNEKYSVRYNDLLERKNDLYIRLRNSHGRIEKTIIVKKEDVAKKIIYTKQPNIKLEDYYYRK